MNFNEKHNKIKDKKFLKRNTFKPSKFMNLQLKTKNSEESNPEFNQIKELLSSSFDENDFDDVLNSDKRKFCEYFSLY